MSAYEEGSTAVCRWCSAPILLDLREGGGSAMDWGAGPADWVGNGGIGMDYGCPESPDTDDEGTGGHEPTPGTIEAPAPSERLNDDLYAAKIAAAIEAVDAADGSTYHVKAFVVAESGEPASVWRWEDGAYVQTTRGDLLATWYPDDEVVS